MNTSMGVKTATRPAPPSALRAAPGVQKFAIATSVHLGERQVLLRLLAIRAGNPAQGLAFHARHGLQAFRARLLVQPSGQDD